LPCFPLHAFDIVVTLTPSEQDTSDSGSHPDQAVQILQPPSSIASFDVICNVPKVTKPMLLAHNFFLMTDYLHQLLIAGTNEQSTNRNKSLFIMRLKTGTTIA
jgi:hypothetical protein